jgi:ferric-dicitrate binding protein FerR (iron transport regulator)
MSSDGHPNRETLELVAAFRDETLTPDQQRRLQELLQDDAETRRYFLKVMALHGLLETRFPASDSDDRVVRKASGTAGSNLIAFASQSLRSHGRWVAAVAIAVSLLIAITGYLWRHPGQDTVQSPGSAVVATIGEVVDVVWMQDGGSYVMGDTVFPGHICLQSGLIRLSYRHGVIVTIEGPADYEILTHDTGVLHKGRLAAFVPEGAEGFRVSTPSAKVVDLGTEFGLTVSDNGETELSVFDGKVELTPTAPLGTKQVVESGLAYRVDTQGKTHQEPILLAPYRDARDSLARWRIIWEPFGPGAGQKFPGQAGRGWLNPWSIGVRGGSLIDDRTGIFDQPTLFPGTEMYLGLAAAAAGTGEPCCVNVSRSFGSIDEFATAEPYTIELLVRLDCVPADIERVRVFGIPHDAASTDSPSWQLAATRQSNDDMAPAWQLARRRDADLHYQMLPVRRGVAYRCFVHVHPQRGLWRATVSNRRVSVSNAFRDALPLQGKADGSMTLGVEVTGKPGRAVKFSLDAIRIQNPPTRENR